SMTSFGENDPIIGRVGQTTSAPQGGWGFGENDQVVTPAPALTPAAAPNDQMGMPQAFGRGAAQGGTLGLADEMSGAAAASPIPGNMQVSPIPNAIDTIAGGARLLAEKVAPSWF